MFLSRWFRLLTPRPRPPPRIWPVPVGAARGSKTGLWSRLSDVGLPMIPQKKRRHSSPQHPPARGSKYLGVMVEPVNVQLRRSGHHQVPLGIGEEVAVHGELQSRGRVGLLVDGIHGSWLPAKRQHSTGGGHKASRGRVLEPKTGLGLGGGVT